MLPMAFTCIVAAAVWHYQGRGLAGWLWSLAVIAIVYFTLSLFLIRERNSRRALIVSPNEQRRLLCHRHFHPRGALAAATLPEAYSCRALFGASRLLVWRRFSFLLGAEFVGLVQVFVYVGAVAVLIVFTILLTRREVE